MASNTTSTNEPYGLGSPLMLEKIDKLFACGVGELVNLPQIVVVGDQSCGKSSVLEGLIKKPLPRDSGLCTRFATQIIFRRALQDSIVVSIIPERDASPDHCARMRAWGREISSLDSQEFAEIMEEVHDLMGLSKADEEVAERKPTFSNDVFCLEISGPEQEHLSVIDVPGIFKSTTEGLTTKADIQLVRNMVKSYMDNPRSVMLTVVPANVDVATQEILELATEADPLQDRTLGVLTKPDLVDKGAEPKVLDLLEGRSRPMKLGWHMIRNPGQKELWDKTLNRNALETSFFRSQVPWNDIDKDKVGITALRARLNEVLSSLVKREFPKVKVEIKGRLNERCKKLSGLGPERSNTTEQLAYLTKLATKFQRLVHLALNANHGADDAFNEESALHISPKVMSRMKDFSDDMTKYGQTYSFLSQSMSVEDINSRDNDSLSESQALFEVRKEEDVEQLQDILHPQSGQHFPVHEGIQKWLLEVFQRNRGFELGVFNASILATVMQKQSMKWADISLGFVSDVIVMVHGFVLKALSSVCTDDEICRSLVNALFDELMQRYQRAIGNTMFLLEVEGSNTPMTMNHYFNDNLQKNRQSKVAAELQKNVVHDRTHGSVVPLRNAMQTHSMSNEEHVILDIHDILKAYYKVSLKTFVDNVCKQATMHHLLHPDKGPLALFSPTFVSELAPDQLEEIAGEALPQKRQRAQWTKEIESLNDAMKILARA